MNSWSRDVLEFHRKFGLPVNTTAPAMPSEATIKLRQKLHGEECLETHHALEAGDVVGTADGIVDQIYVLLGTAISCGIDLDPVWEAVHAANMRKEGGGTRWDGKILKPAGWQPPDVAAVLMRQGWVPKEE